MIGGVVRCRPELKSDSSDGSAGHHVRHADPTQFFDEDFEGPPIEGTKIGRDELPGGTVRVGGMESQDRIIGVDRSPHLTQVDLIGRTRKDPTTVGSRLRSNETDLAQLAEDTANVHWIGGGAL